MSKQSADEWTEVGEGREGPAVGWLMIDYQIRWGDGCLAGGK